MSLFVYGYKLALNVQSCSMSSTTRHKSELLKTLYQFVSENAALTFDFNSTNFLLFLLYD